MTCVPVADADADSAQLLREPRPTVTGEPTRVFYHIGDASLYCFTEDHQVDLPESLRAEPAERGVRNTTTDLRARHAPGHYPTYPWFLARGRGVFRAGFEVD